VPLRVLARSGLTFGEGGEGELFYFLGCGDDVVEPACAREEVESAQRRGLLLGEGRGGECVEEEVRVDLLALEETHICC
jgi:hypothetical protein